jgi:hypothetical protein
MMTSRSWSKGRAKSLIAWGALLATCGCSRSDAAYGWLLAPDDASVAPPSGGAFNVDLADMQGVPGFLLDAMREGATGASLFVSVADPVDSPSGSLVQIFEKPESGPGQVIFQATTAPGAPDVSGTFSIDDTTNTAGVRLSYGGESFEGALRIDAVQSISRFLFIDALLTPANPDPCSGSGSGQADSDGDGRDDGCDPDDDDDGVLDTSDNCPLGSNASQDDGDGDGQGDACDGDDDNDGVADPVDDCPTAANTEQSNLDGDALGDACDPDDDGDGLPDSEDDCPTVPNAAQSDLDADALGDACDADDDGDGIDDVLDNCPLTPNTDQRDLDADGAGAACDLDDDADSVADLDDNCAALANPDQADFDGDGQGDACDPDDDGDSVADPDDNCTALANPDQADLDGDGHGDACDPDDDGDSVADPDDNCAALANADQADFDGDGQGDACDGDGDGDGVGDDVDSCPSTPNGDQLDLDGDGQGDACDPDDDGDDVENPIDNCPTFFNPVQGDTDADALGDECDGDDDGDGVVDAEDNCAVDANDEQLDTDDDGRGDACDPDDDDDGRADGLDLCPGTAAGVAADPSNGCSIEQLCPCPGPRGSDLEWKNHGQYASCIATSARTFFSLDLLTGAERDALIRASAQSVCGRDPCKGKALPGGGTAVSLVIRARSFQAWGPNAPTSLRVFAGTNELFAGSSGEYVVPVRTGTGSVIRDALDVRRLPSSTVPRGALVVLRRGDGSVVLGLAGYLKKPGKVALEATVTVSGARQGNEHNLSFESQGNGFAVLGQVSEDEILRQQDGVLRIQSTVDRAADLVSLRTCD